MCLVLPSAKVLVKLVGFFCGLVGNNPFFFDLQLVGTIIMDELSRSWGKLSLSEKENAGTVLPQAPRVKEFILAAKFFLKLLRFYDKSSLEEDKGGGPGSSVEITEGEISVQVEPVEVIAPMEAKDGGEGINANVSEQLMAGLNSQLQPDNGQKVNEGEYFPHTLNSPQINPTAGLRNNQRDMGSILEGNNQKLISRNKGEVLSTDGGSATHFGMSRDCHNNQLSGHVEVVDCEVEK